MGERTNSNDNPNALIGLTYLEGSIEKTELVQITDILKDSGLDLLYREKESRPQASLDEIFYLVTFFLHNNLVIQLTTGIGTNALWDAIKLAISYTWDKISGKTHFRITSRSKQEKVSLGIEVKLSNNTHYKITINSDESVASESMDKLLAYFATEQEKERKHELKIVKFKRDTGQWEDKDIMKYIETEILAKNQVKSE